MPAPPRTQTDTRDRGFREIEVLRADGAGRRSARDKVIAETPVALVYNGVPFAVMMATPCDLEDFALGFALSEGIVASAAEFELVDVLAVDRGISLQGLIPRERFDILQRRKRSLSGRSGCGLCGIESLEEAVRPTPRVAEGPRFDRAAIAAGMRELARAQPFNAATGGAHAAAFISRGQATTVREDVGRHNALDKLIGALARTSGSSSFANGFLAITSRASWEMVHKAAHAGIAVIAAISAPTSLAIEAADGAGITLIAFARDESMNIYSRAARIA
jgi:formate dehydrogenase accessory protein FdhD